MRCTSPGGPTRTTSPPNNPTCQKRSPPATAFGGCGSDLQVLIHASGSSRCKFPPTRPSQPSGPVETSDGSAPSRAEDRRLDVRNSPQPRPTGALLRRARLSPPLGCRWLWWFVYYTAQYEVGKVGNGLAGLAQELRRISKELQHFHIPVSAFAIDWPSAFG
jgi:hypothetical protein